MFADRSVLFWGLLAACALADRPAEAAPRLAPPAAAEPSPMAAAQRISRYNVSWNAPSRDASGVMPLGNGDLAAGVYAIQDGDLYLLLAKNDAFTYLGDIYKTGRVRIALDPNPFGQGKPFRQMLDLPTGSIRIAADGVTLRIWADANRPLYHVEIHSPHPIAVTAHPEFWERFDGCSFNVASSAGRPGGSPEGAQPTQDVRLDRGNKILWYFPVGDRSVYPEDLKFYDVEHMAARFADPYRHNTFGNLLESPELSLSNGVLAGQGTAFDIRIHALTMQTPSAATWIEAIEGQAAPRVDTATDWDRHQAWWARFWDRSWIVACDNT
nr:DUF5703 domain-containing protein [Pirellulaceae bacterium]